MLRCETDEQCRSIQRGQVWAKRLGKWILLYSIGVTLFINDITGAMFDLIAQALAVTTTLLYRCTVGLFVDVPNNAASLVALVKFFGLIELALFFGIILMTIRWAYADCRISSGGAVTFRRLAIASVFTNVFVYFGLRLLAQRAGLPI